MSLTLSVTVKNSDFIAIALFSGLHGVWRYVAKAAMALNKIMMFTNTTNFQSTVV